ncbi:MAG: HAD family hydrolase [Lautropia sp.]
MAASRPPGHRFGAVVFDCDGVLVDSEPITNRVLRDMLRELGLDFDLARTMDTFLGKAVREELRTIESMTGEPLAPDWYARFVARRNEALEAEIEAIPGIHEVVDGLRARSVPFAVASGADRGKMRLMLGRTGLLPHFEHALFGADMVERAKPAPDVYLLAIEHLRTPASATAVVEDSAVGTRAGVAAGATVFGYSRFTRADDLRAAGASATFDAMPQALGLLGF